MTHSLFLFFKQSRRKKLTVIDVRFRSTFLILQFQISFIFEEFTEEEITEISPLLPLEETQQESDYNLTYSNVYKIDNYYHIESFRQFRAKDSSKSDVMMFTFPQCPLPLPYLIDQLVQFLKANMNNVVIGRYIGCQEKHEDGNLHSHILVKISRKTVFPKRLLSRLYIVNYHPNVMLCKNFLYSINYLTKHPEQLYGSDQFEQEFQQLKEQEPKELAKNHVSRNKVIFQAFKNGTVGQMIQDGVVSLKDYTFMNRGYSSYLRQFSQHIKPFWGNYRGIYIYGNSGLGKSTFAKELAKIISQQVFNDQMPPYYKNQSKWFDGYQSNHVVILDDYDCGNILSHFLKIWTDWNTIDECVEVKGEFVQQNWSTFIVTSNYCLADICTNKQGVVDQQLLQALKRRFMILQAVDITENYTCIAHDQRSGNYSIIDNGQIYVMNEVDEAKGNNDQPVSFMDWSKATK